MHVGKSNPPEVESMDDGGPLKILKLGSNVTKMKIYKKYENIYISAQRGKLLPDLMAFAD